MNGVKPLIITWAKPAKAPFGQQQLPPPPRRLRMINQRLAEEMTCKWISSNNWWSFSIQYNVESSFVGVEQKNKIVIRNNELITVKNENADDKEELQELFITY